jgi:MFS family permease
MSTFHWIAIAVVTVVSAARLTRLAVYDDLPPMKWLREKAYDKSEKWGLLWYCSYCFSFWATLFGPVLIGYYSHWHDWWWIVFGSLAASYLAAILVIHDGEPADSKDES